MEQLSNDARGDADVRYVTDLVGPVAEWLARGGDATRVSWEYFTRRRELLTAGVAPSFEVSEVLGRLDIAMDAFEAEPDRLQREIDEGQLRLDLRRDH